MSQATRGSQKFREHGCRLILVWLVQEKPEAVVSMIDRRLARRLAYYLLVLLGTAQSSAGFNRDGLCCVSKLGRALRARKVPTDASTDVERSVEFQLHTSIASIPAEAWDGCHARDGSTSPFLEHSWLRCLEESKCASSKTGWVPQHVSIKIDGETKGYMPLYIKGHSLGEFIFDQAWADAAYQNGIEYYPKILSAVPFTPATGSRILWHPSVVDEFDREDIRKLRRSIFRFVRQLAATNGLSSAHCNFLTEEEATDLAGPLNVDDTGDESVQDKVASLLQRLQVKDDYIRRTSLQYHWHNRNPNNDGKPYESFEDYLSCFKSKRRINIRRERRRVHEDQNIRVDAVWGREILKIPGLLERMFEIYLSTIDKMMWGRQYLTVDFFQMLGESSFIDNLCFMCARMNTTSDEFRAEDVFAGTFSEWLVEYCV